MPVCIDFSVSLPNTYFWAEYGRHGAATSNVSHRTSGLRNSPRRANSTSYITHWLPPRYVTFVPVRSVTLCRLGRNCRTVQRCVEERNSKEGVPMAGTIMWSVSNDGRPGYLVRAITSSGNEDRRKLKHVLSSNSECMRVVWTIPGGQRKSFKMALWVLRRVWGYDWGVKVTREILRGAYCTNFLQLSWFTKTPLAIFSCWFGGLKSYMPI